MRDPAVIGAILLLPVTGSIAFAQEQEGEAEPAAEEPLPRVEGALGAGAIVTSGNTESQSLNLDVSARLEYEVWRHTLKATGYQASEDGNDTAERYTSSVQSDYSFTPRTYLFVRGSYQSDKFGAFDRRATVATGLGHRFIDTEETSLDLEAGVGHRVSEPDGTNDRDGETIARFHGTFDWQFSEASRFTQELEVESGEDNTESRSVSALRSKLVGNLAWRFSHEIVHNSDVPAGSDKTDTYTAVSIEYAF